MRPLLDTPMDTSQWPTCPRCGLPNIPERHICKRCRAAMDQAAVPILPYAATETTGTLYTTADAQQLLFLCPAYLEYRGPSIAIRTAWRNIVALRVHEHAAYLWIATPSTLMILHSGDATMDAWRERTIPLHAFGYPTNQSLLADLHRFAAHITPP